MASVDRRWRMEIMRRSSKVAESTRLETYILMVKRQVRCLFTAFLPLGDGCVIRVIYFLRKGVHLPVFSSLAMGYTYRSSVS